MSRFDPHSWCDDSQPVQRHLDLELAVDFEARVLSGRAIIHLQAPGEGPLDLDGRGLEITSVATGDGRDISWAVAETEEVRGDRLRLDLPAGTEAVTIAYKTGFEALALGWLDPPQTAGGKHPFLFSQCQGKFMFFNDRFRGPASRAVEFCNDG